MKKRAEILTIAGFDPSGGAGILADVKTFEKLKCYGFAVQTANTIQTEDSFDSPNWIESKTILSQLKNQLSKRKFKWVKIGLVESLDVLREIIDCLKLHGEPLIVWDPVLAASAGYDFGHDLSKLEEILADCYLITPNREEVVRMFGEDFEEAVEKISDKCMVLITTAGMDKLIVKGERHTFKAKNGIYNEKHGSGCVLSSALTAHLALGYPIHKSVLRSKRYIESYLSSSSTLLGYHR